MSVDISVKSRSNVIYAFSSKRILSKGEIEKATSLSPASVSIVMSRLEDEGLVQRASIGISCGGRRPVLYKLADSLFVTAAYFVTLRGVILSVVDINENTLASFEYMEDISGAEGFKNAFRIVTQQLKEKDEKLFSSINAVSIAVPGIIDYSHCVITLSNPLSIEGLEVSAVVRDVYRRKMDVRLFNDSDALILGEYFFGNHEGKNLAYILLDDGIGFAVIQNGKLMASDNCGMELGHTVIALNGKQCRCGRRGCAGTLLNRNAIASGYAEQNGTEWLERIKKDGYKALAAAANAGDKAAVSVIEQQISYLAVLCANVINLFNPARLLLGGPLAEYEGLEKEIEPIIRNMSLAPFAKTISVCASRLDLHSAMTAMARQTCLEYFFKKRR